ncbi:MAG: 30S ribosomal protein S21 [Rhodobacteraceae bacterium]|nr:30S ribosomal protein S21 [Paracoccaceae bacterium]
MNPFKKRPHKSKPKGPKDEGLKVYVRDGRVDDALSRLRKRVERSGVLDDVRERQYYTKPSAERHKKKQSRKNSNTQSTPNGKKSKNNRSS